MLKEICFGFPVVTRDAAHEKCINSSFALPLLKAILTSFLALNYNILENFGSEIEY